MKLPSSASCHSSAAILIPRPLLPLLLPEGQEKTVPQEFCEIFCLVSLLVETKGHVSSLLLCPHPEQRPWHVLGAQKIFVSQSKLGSLPSRWSHGYRSFTSVL